VFGEWPDALTLLGALIVVATGLFTLWRERHVAKEDTI
jgi:S-adenosylmethionine uptake transporter